jgi:hypothetical protein
MALAAKEAVASAESGALCGVADRGLADQFCREIGSAPNSSAVSVVGNLPDLLEGIIASRPRVILLTMNWPTISRSRNFCAKLRRQPR